jgi:dTDP-4-dehydrorhamnose reductase
MAKLAAKLKARVILASSDQVFDGLKGNYREGDRPLPVNVYGETKKAAERSLFATVENAVVVRINNTYGSPKFRGSSFSEWILGMVKAGDQVFLFKDQYRSPIDVITVVKALVELVENPFHGLLHLGGANRVNRLTFGKKLIELTGSDVSLISETVSSDFDPQGFMPRDTSFDITLARQVLHTRLPGFEEGIRLVYDCEKFSNT